MQSDRWQNHKKSWADFSFFLGSSRDFFFPKGYINSSLLKSPLFMYQKTSLGWPTTKWNYRNIYIFLKIFHWFRTFLRFLTIYLHQKIYLFLFFIYKHLTLTKLFLLMLLSCPGKWIINRSEGKLSYQGQRGIWQGLFLLPLSLAT